MLKLSLTLSTLILTIFSVSAQAHNGRHAFGYNENLHANSWLSPYPATGLIAGISYRSYNNRLGLQSRLNNTRYSTQRSYQRGYRHGYRDARREYEGNYRHEGSNSLRCYELSYDRFGNQVRRSLPASACRH